MPLLHCALYDERIDVAGVTEVARFAAREQDIRRAIVKFAARKKPRSGIIVFERVDVRPEHQNE